MFPQTIGREKRPGCGRDCVDQRIDLSLPIKRDVLGTVPGDDAVTCAAQKAGEWHRIGCRELDELDAVRAHRILLLSQIDDRGA